MAAIQARLDLAPTEAAAYYRSKGLRTSWSWTDLDAEEHVHSFTVARATSLDVVSAIDAELRRTMTDGMGFPEFLRTLRPRLQDMGWWGRKEVLDADTGELATVQLGSERRLRTIFQTNVQTAYMAGLYTRLQADAATRPYWQYLAVLDDRTRPTHRALNGRIWRFDDPIWSVIFPPNGWGCRCHVRALTAAEVEAMGLTVESGNNYTIETEEVPVNADGDRMSVRVIRFTDPATGQQTTFRPDPGWDYNAGRTWARYDPAGDARDAVDAQPLTASTGSRTMQTMADTTSAADTHVKTWADAGRPSLADRSAPTLPAPAVLDVASDATSATRSMVRQLLGDATMRTIQTPVEPVTLRAEWLPGAGGSLVRSRTRYADYALATLQDPLEVWLTPYADGTYRMRYLATFDDSTLMLVRQNRDGSLVWDAYDLLDGNAAALDALRVGNPLYTRSAS